MGRQFTSRHLYFSTYPKQPRKMKVLMILSVLILVLGSSMGKTYLVETDDTTSTDHGENSFPGPEVVVDPEYRRRYGRVRVPEAQNQVDPAYRRRFWPILTVPSRNGDVDMTVENSLEGNNNHVCIGLTCSG